MGFILRVSKRQAPKLPFEVHNATKVTKDIKRLIDTIEDGIKKSEDDRIYFEIKRASLSKLLTNLNEIEHALRFQKRTGISTSLLKEKINYLPGILSSIDRKKALILLKVFTVNDLRDVNKTKDIFIVLDDLKVKEQERKENIINDAINLASEMELRKNGYIIISYNETGQIVLQEQNTKDSNSVSSYMTDEYIALLTKLRLTKTEIEEIANKHGDKTLNEWAEHLTKKLALQKEPKVIASTKEVLETRTNLANQNSESDKSNNHNNSQPQIAETLTSETPLVIEPPSTAPGNEQNLLPIPAPKPLTKEDINKLIINQWWSQTYVPDYKEFTEAMLHKLQKKGVLNSDLTIEKFEIKLARLGLTEAEHLKRLPVVNGSKIPQAERSNVKSTNSISAPDSFINSLIDEKTKKINPKGHVLFIRSEIREVEIVDEPGHKTMKVSYMSSPEKHQLKLDRALELLQRGELKIYGSRSNNALLKVESAKGPLVFVCLHSYTDDRILGEYNKDTGELVFNETSKSHKRLKSTVEAHK